MNKFRKIVQQQDMSKFRKKIANKKSRQKAGKVLESVNGTAFQYLVSNVPWDSNKT